MKNLKTIFKALLILASSTAFVFIGCKEPFEPNLPSVPQGYLVVEGFINAKGATEIKLSRTTPLDVKKTFKAELNASLKVEGDDNTSFSLTALPNGRYSGTGFINPQRKYRLRIKTKDSKEYLSDFVSVKITPPIDSISWQEEEKGVQVYVDTHDTQNNTTYYKYDFDETWEIRSAYAANYKVESVTASGQIIIVQNNPSNPQIFYCWKYDTSTSIILASSAKLDKDIIHLQPIVFLPAKDERLGIRYSIQLRQYALDKEGYQFMEQMKKNTEALGTIFDPQPSLLKGNIHSSSDPNEIVIGYIPATTVEQTRIFISASQLVNRGFSIYSECPAIRVPNKNDSLRAALVPPAWPHNAIFEGPSIIAYDVSESRCVDCRLRGGINVRPSFW
jgi:hypothetical protein